MEAAEGAADEMTRDPDIHEQAKRRFLESIDSYECCGGIWKNGTPCLSRICPVEAERQKVMQAAEAAEKEPKTK